ncbi:hypothetical protein AB0L97_32890 [Nocardia sp. NPDC051911]|uniref:hypothetical protein n=1 Tax=Nocardia sp. NPDC051911 TaxID=3154648 RepID=UPI003412448F
MTIEEFIEARLIERASDLEAIRYALFRAEMDRRGNGPGCASFGSVMSRSEDMARRMLAEPERASELTSGDRIAVAAVWRDHPDYREAWAT